MAQLTSEQWPGNPGILDKHVQVVGNGEEIIVTPDIWELGDWNAGGENNKEEEEGLPCDLKNNEVLLWLMVELTIIEFFVYTLLNRSQLRGDHFYHRLGEDDSEKRVAKEGPFQVLGDII